jgi:hypothetical protein
MTNLEIEGQDEPHGLVHEQNERGPQSPMEALRAKRDERAAKRDVLIPVIGYEEMELKVKYRLLDRHETDEIVKRVRRQTKDRGDFMYRVLVDTIILACEGFFLGTEPDIEPLVGENGTGFIESYASFAKELKGEEIPTHRQAVLYVFGDNEFTVGQHGLLLNRWLGDTNLDIDEELLGE